MIHTDIDIDIYIDKTDINKSINLGEFQTD